jgi:transposase
VGQPSEFSAGLRLWHSRGKVNLKRRVVRKDAKEHVYYSLSETIRLNKNRTMQRRVLNLGELNTTQTEQWQRSIEVIDGGSEPATAAVYRYFEGQAGEIPVGRRGYSRDSRPDALQLILAMVVTEEGLPLSYEVFEGNRADVTTLEEILDSVERKHGKLGRVWVFDRGIVSEENLNLLRSRGASYLVATPKRLLTQFQKDLLAEDWTQVANHPQIQVKRIERNGDLCVLTRSLARAEKERAMRQRVLKGLRKDLAKLSQAVRSGRVRRKELIYTRLGRLAERWPSAWSSLKEVTLTENGLVWRWDRKKLRHETSPI